MTKHELKYAIKVCKTIDSDMETDARDFDGKPFNGKVVAEYFGNQGAAISALANLIERLLKEIEL